MNAAEDLELRAGTDFEFPEPGVLVAYLIPDPSSVPLAKTMFTGVACELGMEASERGAFTMEASIAEPFRAKVEFSLLTHATKGYLAVLRWKQASACLSAIASLLSSVDPAVMMDMCNHTDVSQCREWYHCKKHGSEGLRRFQDRFFRRFQVGCCTNNLTYVPADRTAICLDAICLPMQTMHSALASFNEKRNYYVDVPPAFLSEAKQLVIEVAATKKFSLAARHNAIPAVFLADATARPSKMPSGHYNAVLVMGADSRAQHRLLPGRWFFQVKGAALFFQTSFTIYAKVDDSNRVAAFDGLEDLPNQPQQQEVSPSNAAEQVDTEEEWVMVADDSSPAGRKGRAQLVMPIPHEAVNRQTPPSASGVLLKASQAVSIPGAGAPGHVSGLPEQHRLLASSADQKPLLVDLEASPLSSSLPSISDACALSEDSEPPHQFFCPITRSLMVDPVVAGDGHSYELKAIEQWLEGHIRSPMTSQPMDNKMLVYNYNLRSQIDEWRQAHPHWAE